MSETVEVAWVRLDAVQEQRDRIAADLGAHVDPDDWAEHNQRLADRGELCTVHGVDYVRVDGSAVSDYDPEDMLTN